MSLLGEESQVVKEKEKGVREENGSTNVELGAGRIWEGEKGGRYI